ncbi:MAG: hypothetical protein KKA60_01770 [Proteobacteria bacterium]|nr:hypothetical protein [Pseudomonadota bacterium]
MEKKDPILEPDEPEDGLDENPSILAEFWEFVRTNKVYWILPIVIVLAALSLLIVFTESSTIAPFVYALF